jgi:hypothetical protein
MHFPWHRLRPLALLLLLAGCRTPSEFDSSRNGPFFRPTNFHAVARMPAEIRRVLVLPTADDGRLPEDTLDSLDTVLQAALGGAQRFEVVPISRPACARLTGARAIRSVEALPHDFLARLVADYAADAVLFTDVTTYSPYPPLSLGLRAKLVRTDNGTILWSFDTIFSATNTSVVNAARRHWLDTAPAGTPADFSVTALQSPQRFAAYATSAAFATLPPR